jgi:predicted amidohydrolase YtcJ
LIEIPLRKDNAVRTRADLLLPLVAMLGMVAPSPGGAAEPIAADLVLKNGTVIDGTGSPGRRADVAIRGERIVAVGTFDIDPRAKVIDASAWIVAPGFIDLHTHSDAGIAAARTRANRNYQAQGVTTIVTGNCGGGTLDVAKLLDAVDANGAGTNVIHLIPHGGVRAEVMGNADRAPTEDELGRMKALIEQGMKAGAWGMSTGLIYLPGRFSQTAELIALSRVVAQHGGLYASHIRNEGEGLLRSIDEILTIGKEARLPVHVSHLKASGKASWGLVTPACARIDEARKAGQAITADQYPYIASSTNLAAMVIPAWAQQEGIEGFNRLAADLVQGPKLRREIQESLERRDGGASIRIARYRPRPDRVGKDLAAIAVGEETTPVEVVIDIQRHGGAAAISFGMNEDDVRTVMRHDFVATASDGSAHVPGGGDQPHPRSYGTFPRKIRYALDEKVITLEQAIRSSSALPAEILRLPDRGLIRTGAIADIVVFDPASFRDAATFDQPTRSAPGVAYLFINGVAAIADGKPQEALPGRALRLTKDGPADLILKVGRIWTGDRDRPWAEALAARGGVLVAVGAADDVERYRGPKTRVVTQPRAFATPGLIDAHCHLASLGSVQDGIDLRGVDRLDEVARRVKERMDAQPGDSWIIGRNWDQSLWPNGAFPTAAVLDAVAPDRPVFLTRVDGHAGWANSEALRRAKVTTESQAPAGGQIVKDTSGNPSGILVDGAKNLVARVIPRPSPADTVRRLLAGQAIALKAGLTGIHDAGVTRSDEVAYRDLDAQGQLKLRVHGMALPLARDPSTYVSREPIAAKPGARFEMRAIKLFIDGAMGSRGGLLFEPYSDDPGNSGLLLTEPEVLRRTTEAALRHGWQVCTHAIGDKGNSLVLGAYAAARAAVPEARDPRLRIEHAQVVRKADVDRFAALGIIASMQPSHAVEDMRWAEARVGPDRAQGSYAWRWFLDAGVPLAFGSDAPVAIVNPFYGLYAALTRQDEKGTPPGGWLPQQRLTLEEALRAHTAGAAHAAFADDRLGTIKPGMRADVTVVDRDLFTAEPRAILDTEVVMTVVDGEVVFEKGGR